MLLFMPLLTWVQWSVPSTFWLLDAGFSVWGLQSWDSSSSRRLSPSRSAGWGISYIPSEQALEKAEGKEELGTHCYDLQKNNSYFIKLILSVVMCLLWWRASMYPDHFEHFVSSRQCQGLFVSCNLELIKCMTHRKLCLPLNVILGQTSS